LSIPLLISCATRDVSNSLSFRQTADRDRRGTGVVGSDVGNLRRYFSLLLNQDLTGIPCQI